MNSLIVFPRFQKDPTGHIPGPSFLHQIIPRTSKNGFNPLCRGDQDVDFPGLDSLHIADRERLWGPTDGPGDAPLVGWASVKWPSASCCVGWAAAADADIVRIRLSQLSLHRPWQWGAGWLAGQLRERVACFRPVSPGGSTNQISGDSLRGANDMGVSPYIIPSFPA